MLGLILAAANGLLANGLLVQLVEFAASLF